MKSYGAGRWKPRLVLGIRKRQDVTFDLAPEDWVDINF